MFHKFKTGQIGFSFYCKVLVALTTLFVFLASAPSADAKKNRKYASIVMDAETGLILHERYADKKLHPASLTKVMTLLMVFEAMEQGKMNHNTRIRVSRHAASMVPSKLGLKPGSSIKTKDAIFSLVTKSANDVAAAIAEHVGGTERGFATMMTRKARSIGMRNTTFRNASGLHDPKQISTARDMALLGQYVINHYPGYYKYFSRKNFTYKGKSYHNHNRLMSSYKGMDGMKTGFINASGFNLVASAVRNNRRIIGVVFGGRSAKTRNSHMANLLDRGFAKLNTIRVARARVPLPARKPDAVLAMNQIVNPRLASMGQLIGQGDYDLDKIRRIETGMMAISAHTGVRSQIQRLNQVQPEAGGRFLTSAAHGSGKDFIHVHKPDWSIQVGAFASRAATDEMLVDGMKALPATFKNVSPVIAPLKTQDGWLFRGRLSGFTQKQAHVACSYFKECMAIAPHNN